MKTSLKLTLYLAALLLAFLAAFGIARFAVPSEVVDNWQGDHAPTASATAVPNGEETHDDEH
ncbi:hypothetical protein SAMN02745244_02362 [Tessaracoccus bendigoensis DSM 12906]|uniref:Uncharacterized protein n=1 Tax=Tessaracoccus bendigoensis DSM 12906 TaxID=1123357 RepID=A0A1M6IS81_9ACTN|nr:hypothetical protein [Tessaracoccus bendigoensis]SHJ37235.1 hypothetical protein SAMN02745244_02362 [Tessaracoccus bendigoensis DSM 12906]